MVERSKVSSSQIALVSGMIAGEIETITMWPAEYLKTQLQLQSKKASNEKPKFTGIVSGFRYTVSNHGFFALYNGSGVALLLNPVKAGVRFGTNQFLRDQLMDDQGVVSPLNSFMAGLGAGFTEAILVVTPMETIKTKLIQTNQSLISGVIDIFKKEGIGGFYAGTTATILKQSSNQALRFFFMNEYKSKLVSHCDKKHQNELGNLSMLYNRKEISSGNGDIKYIGGVTTVGSLVGGMGAGCFGVICNNPFDVLKTRMQGTDASKYKSTMDCCKQLISKEGMLAFYKGAFTRMVRVVPGQGITFAAVDSFKPIVGQYIFNQ